MYQIESPSWGIWPIPHCKQDFHPDTNGFFIILGLKVCFIHCILIAFVKSFTCVLFIICTPLNQYNTIPSGKTEVYDPEPAVHSFFTSVLPHTFQE